MRIGLVRHFKVDQKLDADKVSASEFNDWMSEYDKSDVIPVDVDLRDINWNKCYASTLPRAITTAKTIYDGEIVTSPLIEEIRLGIKEEYPGIKRHMMAWSQYILLGWGRNSSDVAETKNESKQRVIKFLDSIKNELEEDDNVLIVCHGLIMSILEDELRNRGFEGETVVVAENGQLFLFER